MSEVNPNNNREPITFKDIQEVMDKMNRNPRLKDPIIFDLEPWEPRLDLLLEIYNKKYPTNK